MSRIGDYNRGNVFELNFNDREWVKLEDLYNDPTFKKMSPFVIDGLFINRKGKYGARPYCAFNGKYLVDFPAHDTAVVEQIINDPEAVSQIKMGGAAFTVRMYMSNKYNRECYAVTLIDR